jgi:internalin A
MNPALTLPDVRPLATLCVFLFVSSLPARAFPSPETTPKTFADWCLNKNKESVETKHTVDVLLQAAETQDCNQANKFLSTSTPLILILTNKQITDLRPLSTLTNLTGLDLGNNQITDLRPLSSLTNLTELYLYNNQITNLKPLSSLTNLTYLHLYNNQITDLRPLSPLTNLTGLWLEDNQIADLRPLSDLTKLAELYLSNNPTLTDQTCPVKPASICRFVPEQDK